MQEVSPRLILHVRESNDIKTVDTYKCQALSTRLKTRETERESRKVTQKTILGYVEAYPRAQTMEFDEWPALYQYLTEKFGEDAVTLTDTGEQRLADAGVIEEPDGLTEQQREEVKALLDQQLRQAGASHLGVSD